MYWYRLYYTSFHGMLFNYSIIGIVIYVRISFNGLTSGIVNWIQEYILSAKHSIPQQKEVIFFFFLILKNWSLHST
jgi:hypothetical protein